MLEDSKAIKHQGAHNFKGNFVIHSIQNKSKTDTSTNIFSCLEIELAH